MENDRAREARARRAAARQGLRLEKAKVRDPRVASYGTYWLIDASLNTVVAGDTNNGYGLTLDEIEQALDPRAAV